MEVGDETAATTESPPSDPQDHTAGGGRHVDSRGKHRIIAELKRLEQEARFLEVELEEIERTDKASSTCQELSMSIESKPDPLLPLTSGPLNATWDRWFEGPRDSPRCRCRIL